MSAGKCGAVVKRPEFVFAAAAYPGIIVLALCFYQAGKGWIFEHQIYFSFLSMAVSGLLIVYFILEILMRTFGMKMQGDKLRIRQREGLDIQEIKELNKQCK